LFGRKTILETYKASLRGGKIEWQNDEPKVLDKINLLMF
jgi:hypothetical protein